MDHRPAARLPLVGPEIIISSGHNYHEQDYNRLDTGVPAIALQLNFTTTLAQICDTLVWSIITNS